MKEGDLDLVVAATGNAVMMVESEAKELSEEVMLGAVVLSLMNRYLLKELNGIPDRLGLDFDVTSINFGIFGFFLLVMMVLRPEGLLPSSRRKLELHADVDESDHIGAMSDHQYYDERET